MHFYFSSKLILFCNFQDEKIINDEKVMTIVQLFGGFGIKGKHQNLKTNEIRFEFDLTGPNSVSIGNQTWNDAKPSMTVYSNNSGFLNIYGDTSIELR